MPRCPNCNRETMRTEDWACQWCGYPLLSGSYKKIEKTYKQLKEERLNKPEKIKTHETEPKSKTVLESEIEPISEAESIPEEIPILLPKSKPVPEVESKVESPAEPIKEEPIPDAIPVLLPKQELEREAEPIKEPELEPEPKEETEIIKEPEPEVELESKLESVAEAEKEPEQEPVKVESIPEPELKIEPKEEIEQVQESEPEPKPESPAMELTVEELLSEYETDEAAADKKFANKILSVTGVAAMIDIKDKLETHYIRLTGAEGDLLQSVQCVFDKKYAPALGQLEKGQKVTVQGKYNGSIIAIRMVDCVLVS